MHRLRSEALLLCIMWSLTLCGRSQAHYDVHPKMRFPVGSIRVLAESSVVLMPNTTTLTRSSEVVEVRVSGVDAPLANDLVAMYAPPTADPNRVVPLSWVTVSQSTPDYTTTGSGSVVFTIPNFRSDVVFRLLRNGSNVPGLQTILSEGQSPIVRNTISSQPQQGHLALDAKNRYVVQWVSGSKTPQKVMWGTSPSALNRSATSTAVTYSVSQMCGAPANESGWLDPGWLHHATIPDTPPPGTRVYYRFGSDDAGWAGTFSFMAAPQPGQPTRFLVFNDVGMTQPILFNTPPSLCPPYCPAGLNWDVGYATNSSKLVKYISNEQADVALLIGDLSYAQGFAADWDVFGQMFEPAFTRFPVMVGTGNHERDWPGTGDAFENISLDSGGECNVPFTYRYYTHASYPRLDPGVSYYSLNVGNVHFLVLDSETPSGRGSKQHAFVEADLAAVDRSKTPWIVVGFHRMMAAPSLDNRPIVGDQANMQRLQEDYEELFMQHQVTLVLTGHEHAYARTCSLYRYKCVKDGVTHVMAGNAGAGFTHNFPLNKDGSNNLPSWVKFGIQDQNGYVRVSTSSDSMLVEAISTDDGSIFDSVSIRPPSPLQAARPMPFWRTGVLELQSALGSLFRW